MDNINKVLDRKDIENEIKHILLNFDELNKDTKFKKGQTKKLRSKVQGIWDHTITTSRQVGREFNGAHLSAMNT